MPFNNDDHRLTFVWLQCRKDLAQSLKDLLVAPTAAPEEDQARARCVSECKQPWIIQVGRNDRAALQVSASHYFGIRGPIKTEFHHMNGVVALLDKPPRQRGRQWHIDQEPHFVTSTVSSSAREAA